MADEIKKQIHNLHGLFVTGLTRIAEWNKYVPGMQQTEQYLSWMENSINQSPAGLNMITDETLLDYLVKANEGAVILGTVPQPTPELYSIVAVSGSAIPDVYIRYVRNASIYLYNQPDVTQWANITIAFGDELRAKQNRSEIVHLRLALLNPMLADLHKQSVGSTLAAQAGTQNPIEAAANQNRLLEQFKGALITKCRIGKGSEYNRISDNLAANSALTKTIVSDGQLTYNALNAEYIDVRKRIKTSTGDRLVELLRKLEDHIFEITDALDPDKVGIYFA
jgi:hypothetical protein